MHLYLYRFPIDVLAISYVILGHVSRFSSGPRLHQLISFTDAYSARFQFDLVRCLDAELASSNLPMTFSSSCFLEDLVCCLGCTFVSSAGSMSQLSFLSYNLYRPTRGFPMFRPAGYAHLGPSGSHAPSIKFRENVPPGGLGRFSIIWISRASRAQASWLSDGPNPILWLLCI